MIVFKGLRNRTKGLYSSLFLGLFVVSNPAADIAPGYDVSLRSFVNPVLIQPFEHGHVYFKTPDELDSYFYMYQRHRGLTKNYLDSYKRKLLKASRTFEVPFAFQSCLVFRESKFVSKAKSHMGALGIAQVIPETYNFLAKVLRAGRAETVRSGYELKKELNNNVIKHRESYVKAYGQIPNEYMTYASQVFKEMYLMWSHYLDSQDLEDIALTRKNYKKILFNPDYAIGLSALYLFYLRKRVFFELKNIVREDQLIAHPKFFLSVAGAYNQGARRLLRVSRRDMKDAELNFSRWIRYQSRVPETKYYIKSIDRCMQKGVKKPPVNRLARR